MDWTLYSSFLDTQTLYNESSIHLFHSQTEDEDEQGRRYENTKNIRTQSVKKNVVLPDKCLILLAYIKQFLFKSGETLRYTVHIMQWKMLNT